VGTIEAIDVNGALANSVCREQNVFRLPRREQNVLRLLRREQNVLRLLRRVVHPVVVELTAPS
jgi:hypothetical protein